MNRFTLVKSGADVNHPRLTDYIISQDHPAPKVSTIANPPHAGIIFVNWSSSISIPSGTTRIIDSFPHGFVNYIPTVLATFKFDNGSRKVEGALPLSIGAIGTIFIDADATNINLKYFSTDIGAVVVPQFTLQARYYVMVEHGQ